MAAPRFHTATVTGIDRTTRDAVAVTLRPDAPEAFAFKAGQYLTFRRQIGEVELRRSYSICAPEGDAALRVGIKHVPGGAFSGWANTELQVGDSLQVMPPMGQFTLPKAVGAHLLFVAGGSGITPILSLIGTLLRQDPEARATLIYANRSPASIMFRDVLEDLKNLYLDRLTVIHVLESGQDIPLFSGRLDAEKCAALFTQWIPLAQIDASYICGPGPMREAVATALEAQGQPKERIRFELFAADQPGKLAMPARQVPADAPGIETRITVGGVTHAVTAGQDQSLLDAARAAQIEAPFACTAGVCSTCRARVLKGEVEMRANHALEDDQVRDGYVLTCQSYPVSGPLEIDYDA
ncbi:2Fe-2S iron-sulfur cluster-binding protein [Dinoroseobacter sp. S76]|uniref:2Fe-2S iron-sulfur cluster-binding protein n=1 Tax=Dinoroseobacter sp. S76 TaxID=3415124 RepID=UPI003C79C576